MTKQKWLTVKEASFLARDLMLPRSPKSIRRWCAQGDIDAEKRPNGRTEQWFIDRESLEIKIKEELEFLRQSKRVFSRPQNLPNQGADISGDERTRPNVSAHKRPQADMGAQGADIAGQPKIRDLEDQILLLKGDVNWRDQLLKNQKSANENLMNEIKAQSRYIGHLETKVLGLGGKADQTFLAAPVPNSASSEDSENTPQLINPEIILSDQPHPDQTNLYTG